MDGKIKKLEHHILNTIHKIGGWDALTNLYLKDAKDKKKYISKTNLNVELLLKYINVYRMLIIDVIIKSSIDNMNSNVSLRKKYSNFLGKDGFEKHLVSIALGSTNPTSDYDLNLGGPGCNIILSNLINKFKKISKSGMAYMFDSNFYVTNIVVTNKNKKRLTDIGINIFNIKDNKLDITVNHSKDVIELEFLYLQKKRKEINAHLTSRQIDNKYKKLIKLTKRFDMFLYKNNYKKAKINSLLDFYKLRTEMKYNSIESYYCSSTENIIVWGIQSGNLNKMMKYLTADNFLISTVENMIDLYKHHGNSKKVNKDLVIKVSKYIYRIFFCLNYYLIKSSDVVRKNFDDYLKKTNNINFSNLKKLIDEIIYLRSNIETFDKKKLDYYMNKLKIFTDIFKLNTPLNFNKYNPIFNYFNNFDSRLSFLFTKKKFTKKKFTKKKITKRKITKRKITKKKNEINFFTKKFSYKNTHVKKFVNRLDRMESKI